MRQSDRKRDARGRFVREDVALSHKVGISIDAETYGYIKEYQEKNGIENFSRAVNAILEEALATIDNETPSVRSPKS